MNRNKEFGKIYADGKWRADETLSGPNSMIVNTKSASEAIEYCINELNVKSILDIGCGDFIWMKDILDANKNIKYLGVDIVPEMIYDNKEKYKGINFKIMDVCVHPIPNEFDLILLRDVLIHLSLEDIKKVIDSLRITDFKYILSTTYMAETENIEMPSKRQMYHPLNLKLSPINFGESLKLFDNQNMVLKNSNKQDILFVEGRFLGLWSKEGIM